MQRTSQDVTPLERPAATRGRIALYFAVRYSTPLIVMMAIAASGTTVDVDRLTGLLTAQVAFAVATHAIAARSEKGMGLALWGGMVGDVAAVTALISMSGGAGGPLTFVFTVHALAAGILLSSRAGVRVLLLATVALVGLDVAQSQGVIGDPATFPQGLEAVAALWVIGGGATLFSAYNEHELRRRNAELATVRTITLDIEDSLALREVFSDLCKGVVEGFRFDGAAVLLRTDGAIHCVGAHGITGAHGTIVEERGRLAHAMAVGQPMVTSSDKAARDGSLLDLIGARGYVTVPIDADGLLVATRSHELDALVRLSHHARLAIQNARNHERVKEMSITDPLTGLLNHGEMQKQLAHELGRLQRYATSKARGARVSLILLDIDHFKRFNDRYGHPAGDAVLKGVAAAVRSAVRGFDAVARYGGEEFAVILPETGVDASREVAERIRKAVSSFPSAVSDKGKPIRVTISVGIATAPEQGELPAELVKQADEALYRAKQNGRNRSFHASDAPEKVARVLTMEATRRQRERDEAPARGAERRARAQSSRPKRRTPRA